MAGVGVASLYEIWRTQAQEETDDYPENLKRNYARSREASGPVTPPLEMPQPKRRGRPPKPPVELPREPLVFTKPSRRPKVN